jgi:hypothetical protein
VPAAWRSCARIRPPSRSPWWPTLSRTARAAATVVLDTFCGSGTTILAAERVGRHARALEIEPRFVDVAIRRWQAFTCRDARHAESGMSFDEIAGEGSRAPRFASRNDEAKP